jgi:formylglycine-generating enzyme required for sulfatase activity
VLYGGTGSVEVSVYVLKGEKGPPGTGFSCNDTRCVSPGDQRLSVEGDLMLDGDIAAVDADFSEAVDVSGHAAINSATAENPPDVRERRCPLGYTQDETETAYVLCKKALDEGRHDEMVKVGDFWIDKYEMSVWQFPDCTGFQAGGNAGELFYPNVDHAGNWGLTNPLFACSVAGVVPSASMTTLQAEQFCALSDKSLCTNAEWQAAVSGTYDPGNTPQREYQCLINASTDAHRMTGNAVSPIDINDSCISAWGAEDMVGNFGEWVSDWMVTGRRAQESDGEEIEPWSLHSGGHPVDDHTWNVNGQSVQPTSAFQSIKGLVASPTRGGTNQAGTHAGIVFIDATFSPECYLGTTSTRCCRSD